MICRTLNVLLLTVAVLSMSSLVYAQAPPPEDPPEPDPTEPVPVPVEPPYYAPFPLPDGGLPNSDPIYYLPGGGTLVTDTVGVVFDMDTEVFSGQQVGDGGWSGLVESHEPQPDDTLFVTERWENDGCPWIDGMDGDVLITYTMYPLPN